MRILEEFERQNPKVWSKPNPGIVIAYALFNNDRNNEGLTKKDLKEIPGIYSSEISEGIKNLENTKEILSEKRYFIEENTF